MIGIKFAEMYAMCMNDSTTPIEVMSAAYDEIAQDSAELAALRATVAALTAERADLMAQLAACGNAEPPNGESAAAYSRVWNAAIEAAADVVQSELDWLRDEDDKRFAYGKRIMSTIRAMQPTEHDADMLEAWHERL